MNEIIALNESHIDLIDTIIGLALRESPLDEEDIRDARLILRLISNARMLVIIPREEEEHSE